MRLIDGGKLLEHIKDLPTWWADAGGVYGESMKYPSGMFDCEDVVGSIENALTVDAVVVTRCKDCKHKGWVQEPCHGKSVDYCKIWDCALRNLEATFCSYGERKDGES
mgnify:CR=1 FL=1